MSACTAHVLTPFGAFVERMWSNCCSYSSYLSSNTCKIAIWAASSEFVSSSIPSWQISTAHAQPFRGARDLAFCLKVPLDSLLVWASSEGSGETARMRRLAWIFAARIGDKYQIRLARSIYPCFVWFHARPLWLQGKVRRLQHTLWSEKDRRKHSYNSFSNEFCTH